MSTEEFVEYLRQLDRDEVRAAEAEHGPIDHWDNRELAVLYYRIDEKRPRAIELPLI
jgi:hypothetical protein